MTDAGTAPASVPDSWGREPASNVGLATDAESDRITAAVRATVDILSQSQPTPIREWQARAAEWTDSRFPDDTLERRGLVLGEETGEVLRCILKGAQDIRGGRDHWIGQELPKEAVDVFFCLVALAHRAGFDLADAIEAEWARIAAKDYADSPTLRGEADA